MKKLVQKASGTRKKMKSRMRLAIPSLEYNLKNCGLSISKLSDSSTHFQEVSLLSIVEFFMPPK